MSTSLLLNVRIWTIAIILSLSVNCQNNQGNKLEIQGLLLKVNVFVTHAVMLPENDLKSVFREANSLTSQVNLHLQVISYETNVTEERFLDRIKDGLPGFSLVYINDVVEKYPSPMSYTNTFGCRTEVTSTSFIAIGQIPLNNEVTGKRNTLDFLSRMTVAVIFWSIHSRESLEKDTNCICIYDKHHPCLSSSQGVSGNSSSISRCFEQETVKFDNFACLTELLNASQSKISICGNGIIEANEVCDCHVFNFTCKETCDTSVCSTRPTKSTVTTTRVIISKRNSFRIFTITMIILAVVGVVEIIFVCYRQATKKEKSVSSTSTIARIENF